MNIKTLAAVVGTLSLGSLATGCATAKSADAGAASTEKGAQASCNAAATPEKAGEASCNAAKPAAPKGSQMSCGSNGCGATKPQ